MGLQTFLEKARAKESKKLKSIKLDVKDFGEVEFIRPKEEVLLDYMGVVSSEGEDFKMADIKGTAKTSSEFVYKCCPDLQRKEVREEFEIGEPFDAPLIIFGSLETINIGAELFSAFSGVEVKQEVEEKVKN